jgi:hypothetical protein
MESESAMIVFTECLVRWSVLAEQGSSIAASTVRSDGDMATEVN